MKVFVCSDCGAEMKLKAPAECPLCGKTEFYEMVKPDPTPDDKKYSKLYDEVIEKLEDYEEDCEPIDAKLYTNGE